MDYRKACQLLIKYLISGMSVAFVAFFVPRRKMDLEEVVIISFTAAATFAVLEHYAPNIYNSSLFGAGFGIGANSGGFEPFNDCKENNNCFRWKEEGYGPQAENCTHNEFFNFNELK